MSRQDSEFRCGRSRLSLARTWLGALIFSACASFEAAAAPTEGELRAAVIVAIMRFTSWQTVAAEKAALDVCLVGEPVSASVLLAVSGQQKVATRSVNVRPAQTSIHDCQVAVIGEEIDDEDYEQLITQSSGQSILTICDGCRRGLGEEAIIQLRLRKQRVSFEVNLARARSDNVALDAQLLELAAVVRR